jgi:hypothetical protein
MHPSRRTAVVGPFGETKTDVVIVRRSTVERQNKLCRYCFSGQGRGGRGRHDFLGPEGRKQRCNATRWDGITEEEGVPDEVTVSLAGTRVSSAQASGRASSFRFKVSLISRMQIVLLVRSAAVDRQKAQPPSQRGGISCLCVLHCTSVFPASQLDCLAAESSRHLLPGYVGSEHGVVCALLMQPSCMSLSKRHVLIRYLENRGGWGTDE